jgi:predicted aspartyl protease
MTPDYPLVEVCVSVGLHTFFGEALPDTGYVGAVIIPEEIGREVDVPVQRRVLTMADGYHRSVVSWMGLVAIEEKVFRVRVNALGDQFIIGREVLDQMEICFRFGKTVSLSFTPEA